MREQSESTRSGLLLADDLTRRERRVHPRRSEEPPLNPPGSEGSTPSLGAQHQRLPVPQQVVQGPWPELVGPRV